LYFLEKFLSPYPLSLSLSTRSPLSPALIWKFSLHFHLCIFRRIPCIYCLLSFNRGFPPPYLWISFKGLLGSWMVSLVGFRLQPNCAKVTSFLLVNLVFEHVIRVSYLGFDFLLIDLVFLVFGVVKSSSFLMSKLLLEYSRSIFFL
jgi:hypothetical protein